MDQNEILGPLGIVFGGMYLLTCLALIILMLSGMWMTFKKAGEPGWAAIVPIYNVIVLLRIIGRPLWWILLLLIPLINIVFMFIIYIDLAKSFGKGTGFGVGLTLLQFIFFPILGFGDARYLGPAADSRSLAL